jgi:hypothetical protein
VVDEPVDHGGDRDGVTEDFGPGGEGFVAGHDDRGSFIAAGDEGVEQGGGFRFERYVADFVADQQRDTAQFVQLSVETASTLRGVESLHPLVRGGESDAMSAPGGLNGQRDR